MKDQIEINKTKFLEVRKHVFAYLEVTFEKKKN